jgi:protein phosphatase 1 regulatory subunit 7
LVFFLKDLSPECNTVYQVNYNLSKQMIQQRITDPDKIDFNFIDKELKGGKHVIVQFSRNLYDSNKLSDINGLCLKYDYNFGVRFFGHHSIPFDFKTLLNIPYVKCLYVDCLTKANNVEILSKLKNIKKLSLGVYELKETEFLNYENLRGLNELIIGETKTKALNLDYLKDYQNLKYLIVCSHTKYIEAIGELSSLEFLSLNSIKKTPVYFINKLKKLKTLRFILGGRENIQEINENEIENLEIVWVRGFNNLSNVSKFVKLKTLLIENNIQLSNIHFDKELPALEYLKILNCKTLSSLTGIENLPFLKQLTINGTNIDFESVINQSLPNTLKSFAFYTTKKKVDDQIKVILEKKGYDAS